MSSGWSVDIRAGVEEDLNELDVAVLGCCLEGGSSIILRWRGVDICTSVKEELTELDDAASGC